MAPSFSKSRPAGARTGTLDAFFSQGPQSDKKRKPSTSTSLAQRKATKPAANAKGKQRAAPPPDADVIVIDSSDDDDPPADAQAQGRLVERCRNRREINAVKREPGEGETFGKPFLLLESKLGPSKSSTSSEGGSSSTLQPTSGSTMSSNTLVPDCAASGSKTQSPPGPPDSQDDILEIDNEWGMGDDELAPAEGGTDTSARDEDEVEDSVDVDLTGDSNASQRLEACPLCDKALTGLFVFEIQEHINNCADGLASLPVKDEGSPQPPDATTSIPITKGDANAFSVLMSSHKENEAWKEASIAEDRSFRPTKGNGGRRKAPFYKVMTGMPIAVDAFRYGAIPGVTAYFLTHAHSDHYTNLSSNWKNGPIYCSEGTTNLIIHMLGVDRTWIHPLPMDVPTTIPNTGGVQVTLIEANHCPGSSLFLFEGPQTVDAGDSAYKSHFVGSKRLFRYLHCGDFRASPQHVLHPAVKGKRIDCIYLDTTYLNPKYCFPSQAQVISACADLAKRIVSGQNGTPKGVSSFFTVVPKVEDKGVQKIDRTLVVVGTYSIGKERVVKAIAKALQTKVYCDSRKAAILRCQDDPELHAMLIKDPFEAGVHIVPLSIINSDTIKEYIQRWQGHWSKVLAFRPTGWTYTPPVTTVAPSVANIVARTPHREFTHAHLRTMRNSTPAHQLYGVPYSEHSSFFELTCFALSLDWVRIVATVNVDSEGSRAKIAAWVARWEAERKKRAPGVVPYRTMDYW
ncbi:hypothetical protein EWM64_g2826 [Hericium alpestre]|uniref:DNA repair metallo-beta-lactamase domain-containing protein n=1 Tax=Hericium alpestre TaxID=135208 RepID=A0A4Z0A405_9AGAM|nr:hypothetical protein EWM64_g2826 [Hericium alpestre]